MDIRYMSALKMYIIQLLLAMCLLLAYDVSFSAYSLKSEVKKINVFVLAGQSNMEGYAQKIQLEKLLCAVDEFEIEGNDCYLGEDETTRLFKTITDYYMVDGVPKYKYDKQLTDNEANNILNMYNNLYFRKDLLNDSNRVKIISINYVRNDDALQLRSIKSGDLSVGYGYANKSAKYGPELLIGKVLAKNMDVNDGDIVLIKLVQGGSDLYQQWRSPSMEKRLPPSTKESLYPKLIDWVKNIESNISDYFPEYQDMDLDVNIRGFFWFQGFNDMFNNDYVMTYRDNLIDFLLDLRADLSLNRLPIVIASDANNSINGLIIQQAQKTDAQILLATNYTNTRDLSAYYHYDSASPIIIGFRLGQEMLKLI
ncbi:hypothetical protein KFE69_03425 [bacterium SCSIO 12844]|nr:hypothetical protein KFE69_03425 [bacterium SCSIO 12844]